MVLLGVQATDQRALPSLPAVMKRRSPCAIVSFYHSVPVVASFFRSSWLTCACRPCGHRAPSCGLHRLLPMIFSSVSASLSTARDGQIAQRPEADLQAPASSGRRFRYSPGLHLAVAADHLAFVGEVEGGDVLEDVVPDVKLRPIVEREDPEMLAGLMLAVGSHSSGRWSWVPLAEVAWWLKKGLARPSRPSGPRHSTRRTGAAQSC